jgi:hypothetical protein
MKNILFLLSIAALLTGCAIPPPNYPDYSDFRASDPHSILIVPVVNNSVDVEAADYFLSAISQPVAERGYYVFPVNMVKRVMEEDGLSDADMVHSADPTRLAELFGADSVLYISIERWDAQYAVLTTTVTVSLDYTLKDGDTGRPIWTSKKTITYQPQSVSTGNLIGDLVGAAVQAIATKAKPNYMPLAKQANHSAVATMHYGLPAGPYRPKEYKQDTERY